MYEAVMDGVIGAAVGDEVVGHKASAATFTKMP